MPVNVSLINPGDYAGTFAVVVEAAIRDLLTDGAPFAARIHVRGAPVGFDTEVTGLSDGTVFTTHPEHPQIPVCDISALRF